MSTPSFSFVPKGSIQADRPRDGASPLGSASRELSSGQAEQNSNVVRVGAADVVTSPSLATPALQTFEELEIPASFRQAVESALSADEKILWLGRPSRNPAVQNQYAMLPWVGAGMIAVAVLLAVAMFISSLGAKPSQGPGPLFGYAFAGVLGVIGLVCLLPLVTNPASICRYCYAVTNRRALLVEMSMWQRGPVARTYLPQQLLGLERKNHPTVPGAGDLIFEYEFVMPGNSFNPRTGSLLQKGYSGGLSNAPQRIGKGFMYLDEVREVENLIRTQLLQQLEQSLDAPPLASAGRETLPQPVETASVTCACGATIEAPSTLAGKWVQCPRCAAAVGVESRQADTAAADPVSCREDGSIPADLKAKALAELDASETPVWIGQPLPKLILVRSGGYFAATAGGMLISLLWLALTLAPPAKVTVPVKQGKRVVTTTVQQKPSSPLPPLGLFFVSLAVSSVPLVRWKQATRTCYVLTNRRALVYKEGLFGPTHESYSPLELSGMRHSGSWLMANSGDVIFRSVQVISRTTGPRGSVGVKTIHYGFLAIGQPREVEKLVRATLIDRFVDKLTQASAQR